MLKKPLWAGKVHRPEEATTVREAKMEVGGQGNLLQEGRQTGVAHGLT